MSDQHEDDPWKGVPFEQRLIIWQRELEQHRNQLEQHRIQTEVWVTSVNATVTFAGAAIKGLLLINGGAAVPCLRWATWAGLRCGSGYWPQSRNCYGSNQWGETGFTDPTLPRGWINR